MLAAGDVVEIYKVDSLLNPSKIPKELYGTIVVVIGIDYNTGMVEISSGHIIPYWALKKINVEDKYCIHSWKKTPRPVLAGYYEDCTKCGMKKEDL